jgi:hypothetical protein
VGMDAQLGLSAGLMAPLALDPSAEEDIIYPDGHNGCGLPTDIRVPWLRLARIIPRIFPLMRVGCRSLLPCGRQDGSFNGVLR